MQYYKWNALKFKTVEIKYTSYTSFFLHFCWSFIAIKFATNFHLQVYTCEIRSFKCYSDHFLALLQHFCQIIASGMHMNYTSVTINFMKCEDPAQHCGKKQCNFEVYSTLHEDKMICWCPFNLFFSLILYYKHSMYFNHDQQCNENFSSKQEWKPRNCVNVLFTTWTG